MGTLREDLAKEQVASVVYSNTSKTVTAVLILKNGDEIVSSSEVKAVNDKNIEKLKSRVYNQAVNDLVNRHMYHEAEELADSQGAENAKLKGGKVFETLAGRQVKIIKSVKNDTDVNIGDDKFHFVGMFTDTFETARFNWKGEYVHGDTIKSMRLRRIDGVNYD